MGVMERFVVLLRGVNVGGLKVPMGELSKALTAAGFGSVRTVLATGNAVVDSELSAEHVLETTQAALYSHFGVQIPVLIYPRDDFQALRLDPFPLQTPSAEFHRYLSFTTDHSSAQALASELPQEAHPYVVHGPILYWIAAKGDSTTSPIAKALQRLSRRHLLTTRNLNTVHKVAQFMAQ